MLERPFVFRLSWVSALALTGVLCLCIPISSFAKSRSCGDLFETRTQNLKLVRSAVLIDGRVVYYEHLKARKGRETLVIFSGLFTPMSDFAAFQTEFARRSDGEGLLVVSYSTQIESMIWSRLRFNIAPNFQDLSLVDFSREMTAVLNAENVATPVSVLGYSFGAAPAVKFAEFHKDRVSNLVMVVPLIVSGDHNAQLHSTKDAYEIMAKLNPFSGSTMIESMRESVARNAATSIIESFLATQKLPPSVTKEEAIAGLMAQIRTAEEFDLRRDYSLKGPPIHFLLAGREHVYRLALQKSLADRIRSETTSPGELEVVKDGQHALLASHAEASVEFILRLMRER